MIYPFLPQGPGLEDTIRRRFRDGTGNTVDDTAQFLMQMAQIGPRTEAPEPMQVDGSSVIGLTPEQTTRLMESVQAENQFNAQSAAAQNAQRDRRIDGLNETVFRAREALERKQERERERREQRQQPQYIQGPNGQLTELTPGLDGKPPTTREVMPRQSAPARLTPIRTVDAAGNPVTRYDAPQPGQEYPAYVRPEASQGTAEGGGVVSPTGAAYAIQTLRNQGMTPEQISANFPQLAPYLVGVESGIDPAQETEKRRFIQSFIQKYGGIDAIPEAERTWAALNGQPIPRLPIEKVAEGVEGSRKTIGEHLVSQGFTVPEAVEYLNRIGKSDNVKWFFQGADAPTDPEQWGNDQVVGQADAAEPPVVVDLNNGQVVPQQSGGTTQAGAPVERTLKDGTKVLVQRGPDGKWMEVPR